MAFDLSKLKKTLDLPAWEACAPVPAASAAGSSVRSLTALAYQINLTIFCVNATSAIWAYDPAADAHVLLPASGSAGTFAAGFAARLHPMGPNGTATAGSTTTLTTNLTIPRDLRGYYIRITGGPGAGDVRRIASNTLGANSVITPTQAFSATITASSTYQLITPRLYIYNPHTASTWAYFSRYDWATNAWTTGLTLPAGLGAAWGTDAALASTASIVGNLSDTEAGKTFGSATTSSVTYSAGAAWTVNQWTGAVITVVEGTGAGQVATIASNTTTALTIDGTWTTLDATSKWILERPFESSRNKGTVTHTNTTNATIARGDAGTWTANSWSNYQVRVIGGTGKGQVKQITSNTTTTLTLTGVWTTALDTTSIWVIEGSDDYLYLIGNNAVTMYRYSISGAAWSTLSPGVARAAAPVAGLSLTWISKCSDSAWKDTTAIKNGRYLYSFRANSATLDIYDIALNTWTNGQAYGASGETMTTGCSYDYDEQDNILVSTPGSTSLPSRLLRFDVIRNALFPVGTMPYIQGTAVVGDKLFTVSFVQDSVWLEYCYHWRNSGQELCRVPLWHLYNG